MEKLYILEPEVAGEIGEKSEIKHENGLIREVVFLNYEFFGWLGDELLTTTPCYIVSKSLVDDIIQSKLTGCSFEKVLITKSEEFEEQYPKKELPEFIRMNPLGTAIVENGNISYWSGHDFCLSEEVDLVVSKKAISILKKHKIKHCDIDELIIVNT